MPPNPAMRPGHNPSLTPPPQLEPWSEILLHGYTLLLEMKCYELRNLCKQYLLCTVMQLSTEQIISMEISQPMLICSQMADKLHNCAAGFPPMSIL